MATVVITFFLVRINVYKMDATCVKKRRARISSHRERRWSMNSQRLEEIVAELMRPISDLRRSFDTDLSALLEEYLTEAGLHALDADEDDSGSGSGSAGPSPPVNFAELALLLQQSASIYGRKVDCLYQHVLSVSEALHNSTIELSRHNEEESPLPSAEAQTPSRRRRRASAHEDSIDFGLIELTSSRSTKPVDSPRPPPTLPRMYIELEPRAMADADQPLLDYDGEPIGLLADFHVAWRLQDGQLVDELEGRTSTCAPLLRAIPLLELQAAIEANAPPPPPPLSLHEDSPPRDTSTPLPPSPLPRKMPPPPPPLPKRDRKRKSDSPLEYLAGRKIKLALDDELRRLLRQPAEYALPGAWLARELRARTMEVRRLRTRLRRAWPRPTPDFHGFDVSSLDVTGFVGWSSTEAALASAVARARLDESDDDGFFENSEFSSSCYTDDGLERSMTSGRVASAEQLAAAEWAAWQARVVARAHANEARGGPDVRVLAAAVLRTLPTSRAPRRVDDVLRDVRGGGCDAHVSHVFLATLFMANAGNVEVIQGAPLSLNSFSLRMLSTDERLLSSAEELQELEPPMR